MQVNLSQIQLPDFSRYRKGNLIYYFYEYEEPGQPLEAVKSIGRVSERQEDDLLLFDVVLQDDGYKPEKEKKFQRIVDIPLTEQLLLKLGLPITELARARAQYGVWELHEYQNLYFFHHRVELDITMLLTQEVWEILTQFH